MRFTYQIGAQPLAGYTIQRGIHCGGFGEVYYACSDGGKEVALKLLHRDDREIEIRGVTQCLNLKHPNLVNLFDLKTDSHGDHWVVMEYVSGASLEDVFESFPHGLPLDEVRDWLSGLVAGVAYLHERGIVHRDLKPANVYRENGVVKVGDVGLSKRLNSDRRQQNTQSVGTVYYMAPEVANGQYGPEVDIYSLGVMLYEMITGKLPFNGESTAEILMKHLTAQPDLSPIPSQLRPVLARALEKDPRQRTQTVQQLYDEFCCNFNTAKQQAFPKGDPIPPPIPTLMNGQSKDASHPRIVDCQFLEPIPGDNGAARTHYISDSWEIALQLSPLIAVLIPLIFLFRNGPVFTPDGHLRTNYWVMIAVLAGSVLFFKRVLRKKKGKGSELVKTYKADQPLSLERRKADLYPPIRSWNVVFSELANSFGSVAVISGLLSLGIYSALKASNQSSVMPGAANVVFFFTTAVMGSWILMTAHASIINLNWKRRHRLNLKLLVGACIGSIAYFLDEFLLVDIPRAAYLNASAFSSLRSQPLVSSEANPTWLGYVCFFAVWLGIRNWPREMSPYRKKRLSAALTAGAVVMGYLTTLVFAFPQWYAVLWAITISTTIQLASNRMQPPSSGCVRSQDA